MQDSKQGRKLHNLQQAFVILLMISSVVFAQVEPQEQLSNEDYLKYRRETAAGDVYSFQGMVDRGTLGVKSVAEGNAFMAYSGDINTIFHNPAGLADLKMFNISASINRHTNFRMEHDHYEPYAGRNLDMLEQLWAGNYVLTPEDTIWGKTLINYYWDISKFEIPLSGVDFWDDEYATWKDEQSKFAFNNIIAALPLNLLDIDFTVAAAYSFTPFFDYDQNNFYTPTAGVLDYKVAEYNHESPVYMDVPWYRFNRSRNGDKNKASFALGVQITDYLDAGLRYDYGLTTTNDRIVISEVALMRNFHLLNEQDLFLEQERDERVALGTSEYTSHSFELGLLYKNEALNLGISMRPGYTLNRDHSYAFTKITEDTLGNEIIENRNHNGITSITFPLGVSFGLQVKAVRNLKLSFDIEYNPFSRNEYDLNQQFYIHEKDSSFREWQDQTIIRLGIEYLVRNKFAVMAGYQLIPTTIRPLNYNNEVGLPTADVFSFGVGLPVFKGRFELAYQKTWYRETDLYFSRFSYNRFESSNLLLGYTYQI